MYDFKGFYKENRSSVIGFIVLTIICFAGVWLVYDHGRNEPIYNDTSATVADLENRINGIEQRINTVSARVNDAEKTLGAITDRINAGTELAKEVTTGISGVQGRLDSAVQRSGRIQNIVADIERANSQRTQNP